VAQNAARREEIPDDPLRRERERVYPRSTPETISYLRRTNPLDLVVEALWRLQAHRRPVSKGVFLDEMRTYGIENEHAMAFAEQWRSIGGLIFNTAGNTLRLIGDLENVDPTQQRGWMASPVPPPATGSGPAVGLLSLFDGMGTARIGLELMLGRLGALQALVGSWFAENDPRLSHAVSQAWRRRAQNGSPLTRRSPATYGVS